MHVTLPRPVLAVLAAFALLCGSAPAKAATLTCRELPMLFERFMSQHYPVNADDVAIRQRTADQFLKVIDPSKTLLLERDVATTKQSLAAGVQNGQCPQLEKAYELVQQRTNDNEARAPLRARDQARA